MSSSPAVGQHLADPALPEQAQSSAIPAGQSLGEMPLSFITATVEFSVPPMDIVLGLATLLIAGLALSHHSRLVMVMSFLGLGGLVSLVWMRLDSLDVALAEAAIGGGLLSGLLVWLAVRAPQEPPAPKDRTQPPLSHERRTAWLRPLLGVLCGAVLATVGAATWLRVEQALPAWEDGVAEEMPGTGVEHEVTGVLLAFRAYDTLLESAVLMLAAVAALAFGADGGLGHLRTPLPTVPSTLRWVVRASAPVLFLLGLWLLFAGSTDSGGAFQSGAVLTAMLILLDTVSPYPASINRIGRLGAGAGPRSVQSLLLRTVLVAGVIVFILAGLVGPLLAETFMGEAWLSWNPAWATAAVLTVEVLLTAGIAVALYMLYLSLENPEGVR